MLPVIHETYAKNALKGSQNVSCSYKSYRYNYVWNRHMKKCIQHLESDGLLEVEITKLNLNGNLQLKRGEGSNLI